MLQEMLQQISPLDSAAMETARQHWDAIAKPLHSLGRLEDLVVQLAGITGTANLPPRKKAVLCRQRCCGRGRDADHTGSHCRRYPQFYHGHRFSQRPVPCLRGRCFSRGHRRGGGTALRRHNFQKDRRRHPQLCP